MLQDHHLALWITGVLAPAGLFAAVFSVHFIDPLIKPWSSSREQSTSMAWRSSGASNAGLINNLARNGLIKSDRVKQAMLAVSLPDFKIYQPIPPFFLKSTGDNNTVNAITG